MYQTAYKWMSVNEKWGCLLIHLFIYLYLFALLSSRNSKITYTEYEFLKLNLLIFIYPLNSLIWEYLDLRKHSWQTLSAIINIDVYFDNFLLIEFFV